MKSLFDSSPLQDALINPFQPWYHLTRFLCPLLKSGPSSAFASISYLFHLEWNPSYELPDKTAARRAPDDFCVGLRCSLRGDLLPAFVFRSHGHAAHRGVGGAIQERVRSERRGTLSSSQKYRRRWCYRPHG